MKKLYLLIIFLLLMSGFAFASPEPELVPMGTSVILPPPIESEYPPQPEQIPPADIILPPGAAAQMNPSAFQHISGAPYYTFLKDLGFGPKPTNQQPLSQASTQIESLTDAPTVGPYNWIQDSSQDVEPAAMAYNNNGTVYALTTYIKIVNGSTPLNYYSSTADFVNFYRGQLPMPSGYRYSADPLMAKNAYNGGVAPGRIYSSGIVYNTGAPNGIAVWHTDNGGMSWSQPTLASVNNNSSYMLDKPAIAVSWYSGTLGHVYVAYVKALSNSPTQTQLFVTKSTDGGMTFSTPTLVTTGNIEGPQILVNTNYGYLYVLWVDYGMNAIRMSTSTNFGQTWSSPETAATGNMCDQNFYIKGGTYNVRAGTLPMARFNWAANKICVVWHERQQAGSGLTDVYYTSKSPSGGWQTKVRLNDVQTNDQFMPALDFDSSGNLIVPFYDRRADPNNVLYNLYRAHINPSGSPLESNILVSTFQSNPNNYTGSYADFIGDYQDVWYQAGFAGGAYFVSSSVGIPSVGDIYGYGIQP